MTNDGSKYEIMMLKSMDIPIQIIYCVASFIVLGMRMRRMKMKMMSTMKIMIMMMRMMMMMMHQIAVLLVAVQLLHKSQIRTPLYFHR